MNDHTKKAGPLSTGDRPAHTIRSATEQPGGVVSEDNTTSVRGGSDNDPARWRADAFQDAIWDATGLSTRAKMLALAYARHARDERGARGPAADLTWLTYDRAMQQTGIRKRDHVPAAAQELVAAGWLVVVKEAFRRPTIYRLAFPVAAAGSPDVETTEPAAVVPTSGLPKKSDVSTSGLPDPIGSPLLEAASPHVETSVVPTWGRNISSIKSTSSSSDRVTADVIARTGADDDEAAQLIEKIKSLAVGGIRKGLGAYVRSIPTEDLADHLVEIRAAARPAPSAPARPATTPAWKLDLAARQATDTAATDARIARGRALADATLAAAAARADGAGADVLEFRSRAAS